MSERYLSRSWELDNSHTLSVYRSQGGYRAAERAFRDLTPRQVIEEVCISGLRGRGGAGFPTGRKWQFVPEPDGGPRYLAINADESEPGTFKDRLILEQDPHMLIEGILIAARALRMNDCFIYLRGEYREPEKRLRAALSEAEAAGYLGQDVLGSGIRLRVSVMIGAGAYICGEETAMLESIEGKKGWPRLKPPFPAVKGLFGRPTIVNNVETIACLPHIIERGGAWFAGLGTPNNTGPKLYAMSGDIERPGIVEMPLGTSLKTLIDACGGIRDGKRLKAFIPGGVSAHLLTAEHLNLAMDFDSVAAAGSMLGSAAVILFAEGADLVRALERIVHFFMVESCGQCTPCREGTAWAWKLLREISAGRGKLRDLDDLLDISRNMDGTTICPLGPSAGYAITSFITCFHREFEAAVNRAGDRK